MYEDIDSLSRVIGALSEQQKVISNNIANAYTPGYSKQTYNFTDVLGNLSNPFETELSRKMGAMTDIGTAEGAKPEPVNLTTEMIEMQKLYSNYTMVTRRATTIFSNLRRASQIGR